MKVYCVELWLQDEDRGRVDSLVSYKVFVSKEEAQRHMIMQCLQMTENHRDLYKNLVSGMATAMSGKPIEEVIRVFFPMGFELEGEVCYFKLLEKDA